MNNLAKEANRAYWHALLRWVEEHDDATLEEYVEAREKLRKNISKKQGINLDD